MTRVIRALNVNSSVIVKVAFFADFVEVMFGTYVRFCWEPAARLTRSPAKWALDVTNVLLTMR